MRTRQLVLAAVFAAIIAILAPLSIPTGIVPLTVQTIIIPLIASIAATRVSFSAVAVYLLLGMIGMPVYAGWTSGVGIVIGPTGGYLIGMLLFPLVIDEGLSRSWPAMLLWNLIAAFLQLGFGTLWLAFVAKMAIETAVATGLIAFVIPTIIKVVIVVTLMVIIGRVMRLPIGGKE
ncbi:MAG: biotin transporter BioY [Weissella confusa]